MFYLHGMKKNSKILNEKVEITHKIFLSHQIILAVDEKVISRDCDYVECFIGVR